MKIGQEISGSGLLRAWRPLLFVPLSLVSVGFWRKLYPFYKRMFLRMLLAGVLFVFWYDNGHCHFQKVSIVGLERGSLSKYRLIRVNV